MIEKEFAIEISRPVHDVFTFVDDPTKAPEWLGPCVSLKQLSPGPRQVGTTLRYAYSQSGRSGEMDGAVTAYAVDRHLAMKFGDEMFEVSLDFLLSEIPSGTRLQHRVEIEPQGFAARLMSGMIGSATEKQLREDMEKLKRLLESSSRPTAP